MSTMTPQEKGASIPASDAWTTAGIWVVGATGAAMSWTGWFLLADMCGWPKQLSALLPFAVDVYVITSARVWLKLPWVGKETRKFAAFSTFFAVGLSIAANAAYHLMVSLHWHRAPWPVVVTVSGLAPLMLALVAHLQARLNADRLSAVAPAADPGVDHHVDHVAPPDRGPSVDHPVAPDPVSDGPPAGSTDGPASGTTAGATNGQQVRPARGPRHRSVPVSHDPEAEKARAAYRKSMRQGEPLSDRALGEMFGRSRNWGKGRIREVESGPQVAAPRAVGELRQ